MRPATGFEDRGAHRDPTTSIFGLYLIKAGCNGVAQRQRRDRQDSPIIIAPLLAKRAVRERQSRCPLGAVVGQADFASYF